MKFFNRAALGLCLLFNSCGAPAFAQQYSGGELARSPSAYWLLRNAAVSGSAVRVPGGNYSLHISGTFGGATVALVETIGGGTSITLGSYTSAAATDPCFPIPEGASLQITVAGGSPSALYASLGGVGSCASAGGGGSGDASAANQTAVQTTVVPGTAPAKANVSGGIYNSTPPTFTNGQSGALQFDANGNLKTNIAAGNGVAIDTATLGQAPSTIACNRLTATPTAATTATTGPVSCNSYGYLVSVPYALPDNWVSGVISSAMTGTTSTSLVAAAGAGLKNRLTTIVCSNGHATVGTDILVQDGSGGTTLFIVPAAAVYGGTAISFPVPLPGNTANTAIYVANVTTGASTKCSAIGFKGP